MYIIRNIDFGPFLLYNGSIDSVSKGKRGPNPNNSNNVNPTMKVTAATYFEIYRCNKKELANTIRYNHRQIFDFILGKTTSDELGTNSV